MYEGDIASLGASLGASDADIEAAVAEFGGVDSSAGGSDISFDEAPSSLDAPPPEPALQVDAVNTPAPAPQIDEAEIQALGRAVGASDAQIQQAIEEFAPPPAAQAASLPEENQREAERTRPTETSPSKSTTIAAAESALRGAKEGRNILPEEEAMLLANNWTAATGAQINPTTPVPRAKAVPFSVELARQGYTRDEIIEMGRISGALEGYVGNVGATLDTLKAEEGLTLNVKPDRDKTVIGHGHQPKGRVETTYFASKGITGQEAGLQLVLDFVQAYGDAAIALSRAGISMDDLSGNRQNVVTVMAFQLGRSGFQRFEKFANAVKDEDFNRAQYEMLYNFNRGGTFRGRTPWYTQTPFRTMRMAGILRDNLPIDYFLSHSAINYFDFFDQVGEFLQ